MSPRVLRFPFGYVNSILLKWSLSIYTAHNMFILAAKINESNHYQGYVATYHTRARPDDVKDFNIVESAWTELASTNKSGYLRK